MRNRLLALGAVLGRRLKRRSLQEPPRSRGASCRFAPRQRSQGIDGCGYEAPPILPSSPPRAASLTCSTATGSTVSPTARQQALISRQKKPRPDRLSALARTKKAAGPVGLGGPFSFGYVRVSLRVGPGARSLSFACGGSRRRCG